MQAMGRPRKFDRRILLPLDEDMLAAIDAALEPGQLRLDFIREAISAALERRQG